MNLLSRLEQMYDQVYATRNSPDRIHNLTVIKRAVGAIKANGWSADDIVKMHKWQLDAVPNIGKETKKLLVNLAPLYRFGDPWYEFCL